MSLNLAKLVEVAPPVLAIGPSAPKTAHYWVIVTPCPSPAGYIAEAPDLEGCYATGRTRDDALLHMQDAIAAWIDGAKRLGRKVPPPSMHAAQVGAFV